MGGLWVKLNLASLCQFKAGEEEIKTVKIKLARPIILYIAGGGRGGGAFHPNTTLKIKSEFLVGLFLGPLLESF
jgi:hypothetical protein